MDFSILKGQTLKKIECKIDGEESEEDRRCDEILFCSDNGKIYSLYHSQD